MGLKSAFKELFNKRSIEPNIPQKIFVGWDGRQYEYSDDRPPYISYTHGTDLEHAIQSLLHGYYSDCNFIELFYCLPEIFAPVNEIASRVADATWQLRKIRKTGALHDDEVIYNDPNFNRLFSRPNPFVTFKEFVYQAVCYELLTGKSFQFFNRPDSLPDEYQSILTWINLPAHKVVVETKSNVDAYTATEIRDVVDRYRVPQNGINRFFPPEKVLQLAHLDLEYGNDLRKSRSPLAGAEKAIKNLIPVYEARGMIYIKRGALGFVVSRKSDDAGLVSLNKKEKDELNRDFTDTYGVTNGKTPVTITSVPVEFIRTAMSIEELMPFDETLADAAAIYATLKVPPHLIPSKDKSTYANANSDLKAFYENVIIPTANRYAEAWTGFMKLEESRRYIYPDFSHIEVLQEDKKLGAETDKIKGEVYLQRWQYGTASLNDWLSSFGADPITQPLYEKKLFEYTPEELELAKSFINLKVIQKDVTDKVETVKE